MCHPYGSKDVDVEDVSHHVGGDVLGADDRVAGTTALYPRVVDEHVEPAHLVDELCCGRDRFIIGDIELHEERLIYEAHLGDLVDLVRELPEDRQRILLVGHNPDLEELVEDLTGEDVVLKTCSLAVIDTTAADWQELPEGRCVLQSLVHPREINDQFD